MDKRKKLGPVLGSIVLVVMVAALFLVIRLINRPSEVKMESFFPSEITSFCVGEWCFEKKDGWWMMIVGGFEVPADEEKVETFVKEMSQLRLGEIVSDNPDGFGNLGLDDQGGIKIKSSDRELIVGNLGQDYQSTMVRKAGDSVAYLAAVVWNKLNLANEKYWEKYRITNLPLYQVTKVTLKRAKSTTIVETKDGKWPDDTWINRICHLEAVGYIEEKIDDSKLIMEAVVEYGPDKTTLKIGSIWQKSKYLYWATTNDRYYFEISKADFDLLTSVKG